LRPRAFGPLQECILPPTVLALGPALGETRGGSLHLNARTSRDTSGVPKITHQPLLHLSQTSQRCLYQLL
jgi:hypothetical protein